MLTLLVITITIILIALYSRLLIRLHKMEEVLSKTKNAVYDVRDDMKHSHDEFYSFFKSKVINKLPEETLKVLTEEHRRNWLAEAMMYPDTFVNCTFVNSDIGDSVEATYDTSTGELLVNGMPFLSYIKTLPPVDLGLASIAAFQKWPEWHLKFLALKYFPYNL